MFAFSSGQTAPPQATEKRGDPLGLLYWICVIHSTTITVFLRYRAGRETYAVRGLLALVLLLVCCGGDARMIWWAGAFLVAVLVQRIITLRAIRNGALIHTLDAGRSLVLTLPFISKERDPTPLEMTFCLVVGALLLPVSEFIGGFLMLGMLTLGFRMGFEDFVYKRRLDRLRDAQIEGRWFGW